MKSFKIISIPMWDSSYIGFYKWRIFKNKVYMGRGVIFPSIRYYI